MEDETMAGLKSLLDMRPVQADGYLQQYRPASVPEFVAFVLVVVTPESPGDVQGTRATKQGFCVEACRVVNTTCREIGKRHVAAAADVKQNGVLEPLGCLWVTSKRESRRASVIRAITAASEIRAALQPHLGNAACVLTVSPDEYAGVSLLEDASNGQIVVDLTFWKRLGEDVQYLARALNVHPPSDGPPTPDVLPRTRVGVLRNLDELLDRRGLPTS